MTTLLTLFAAGVLTILLPCILPLVPIVLGVSLAGKRKVRPLVTVAGMVASFPPRPLQFVHRPLRPARNRAQDPR
jgi:cytochrome c biogenesis protein CcdA